MIVCHCAVVNDQQIRELVAEDASDLLDVAAATGAGSFCGGCVPTIASLLSEATGEPASGFLYRQPSSVDASVVGFPTQLRQVVRGIEEDVATRGWPVGSTIPYEAELADRHGATLRVVRAALQVLRHHGVLRRGEGADLVVAAPEAGPISVASALHLHNAGVGASEVEHAHDLLTEFIANDGQKWNDSPGDLVVAPFAHVVSLLEEGAGAADVRGEPPSWRRVEGVAGLAWAVVDVAHRRDLQPGDLISTEHGLAHDLGVSREEVREVLVLLEAYGLVGRQPGPRPTVTVATPDRWPTAELFALYLDWVDAPSRLLLIRAAFEVAAVELAAARADGVASDRLWRRLEEEGEARHRRHAGYSMFHNIHPLIAELAGNRVISHFALATNLAVMRRANRNAEVGRFFKRNTKAIARAHVDIVRAITAGDTVTASERMRAHLGAHSLP